MNTLIFGHLHISIALQILNNVRNADAGLSSLSNWLMFFHAPDKLSSHLLTYVSYFGARNNIRLDFYPTDSNLIKRRGRTQRKREGRRESNWSVLQQLLEPAEGWREPLASTVDETGMLGSTQSLLSFDLPSFNLYSGCSIVATAATTSLQVSPCLQCIDCNEQLTDKIITDPHAINLLTDIQSCSLGLSSKEICTEFWFSIPVQTDIIQVRDRQERTLLNKCKCLQYMVRMHSPTKNK